MQQKSRFSAFSRRTLLAGAAASVLRGEELPGAVRLPRKVRVAMIGLDGHTGDILEPLPRLPDVEMVAFSDPDAAMRARFARNPHLRAAKQYADYNEMLDREKLDVVAVCNNNGERAAAILACAARKLHIAAEKPLATSLEDLDRVKGAIAKNEIRLTTLLPMRYSPDYLALRRIVESGEIGEVVQIGAQKSYKLGTRPEWYKKHATYGGTMPWIGIHMVDLMRWASGREFTEAAGFQARIGPPELIGEMETVTAAIFKLDNGGVGELHMDYFRPESASTHGDDRMRLAGTKGVAEYQAATGVTLIAAGRKPERIAELPKARSLFAEFLDSVYNGKPATLPLADIYRVNEIVLKAQLAAERGQIVKL
jgi:predicted dehydrogenase